MMAQSEPITDLDPPRGGKSPRTQRQTLDPDDYGQVLNLAMRLYAGGDRALIGASVHELHALVAATLDFGAVTLAAIALFEESDRAGGRGLMIDALETLAAHTRPLMRTPS